jgi:hypothetical protein
MIVRPIQFCDATRRPSNIVNASLADDCEPMVRKFGADYREGSETWQ